MAFDTASGQIALHLAGFFAAPAGLIASSSHLSPDLDAALGQGALGRRARNRALADALELTGASFGPEFRARLTTRHQCQLACRLVLMPVAPLHAALRHLTAAIYQARIRGAVLKAERAVLQEILGPEAMQSGLRQAPVFGASLARLARPNARILPPVTPEGSETPQPVPLERQPIFAHTLAVVEALVAAEDPLLARVLAARKLAPAVPSLPEPLTQQQCDAAWRVLEGRL